MKTLMRRAARALLPIGFSTSALLFIAGVVTIFAGFLVHMVNLNLGAPNDGDSRLSECPWKLGAMTLVTAVVIGLGFWLPAPLYQMVQQTARILGGGP